MRLQLMILLVSLAVVGSCLGEEAQNDGGQVEAPKSAVQTSARASFVMPKLFDFEVFKAKYNKHYANVVELVRRTKLFMARAFAVFISAIKYTHRKSSKYLKINPHSDWTEAERDVITNDLLPENEPDLPRNRDAPGPEPAVNPSDIEHLLAEIVQHKDDNPEFAAIAAELEGGALKRRKRNTDPNTPTRERKLSMDDLIGGPVEPLEVSEKYTPSVPSNNPDYEQLQVFSQGADEGGERVRPVPMEEAKRIDATATKGGYLKSLMKSIWKAADYLLPPVEDAGSSLIYEPETKKYKILPAKADSEPEEFYASDDQKLEPNTPDQIYLDHRESGCILPPKDQHSCGACYAFATISVLEYHHCRQTGDLVPFSEQYLVDCGRKQGLMSLMRGCQGGYPKSAIEFIAKHGLELSSDYPYKAKDLTCPYKRTTSAKHMGHSKIDALEIVSIRETEYLKPGVIRYMLEKKGPLIIGIKTDADFLDYGGGVDLLRCEPRKPYGHAMTMIGHGVEDGTEYWLVRNSHGSDWGYEGNYKMAKDVPADCLLEVGFTRGQFKINKSHLGKKIFGEQKKKNP